MGVPPGEHLAIPREGIPLHEHISDTIVHTPWYIACIDVHIWPGYAGEGGMSSTLK